MPSRLVRSQINRSESLSRVSMQAELTFRALLTAVDDYGRLDARPAFLKAELFPMRDSVTSAKVASWVRELAEIDDAPVQLYEVDGRPYLHLTKWEQHRSDSKRAFVSRYPAPPGHEDRSPIGGVYFIEREPGGPIKIGTSLDVAGRLRQLKTACPKASVLAVVPDADRATEKRLHRLFASSCEGGEWFTRTKELEEWISGNARAEWADPGTARTARGQSGQPSDVCRLTSDDCRMTSDADKNPPTPRKRGARSPERYPPGFAQAWKAYPHYGNRSKKLKALKVWSDAGLEDQADSVLSWVVAARDSPDFRSDGGRYTPGMQVWLTDRDFTEPPPIDQHGSLGDVERTTAQSIERFLHGRRELPS